MLGPPEIVDGPNGPEEVHGEPVEEVSPARARAALLTEYRRHLALLAADPDAEPSEEAEAGAILEAETAVEIHEIAGVVRAWYEAHKR